MSDERVGDRRRAFGRDVAVGVVSSAITLALAGVGKLWSWDNFALLVPGPPWFAPVAFVVVLGEVVLAYAAARADRQDAGGMTWGALLWFTMSGTLALAVLGLGVLDP